MEAASSEPAERPPESQEPRPQTPPTDSQRVAFKLGGSEETDLDNNDVETKDIDIVNGEKITKMQSIQFIPAVLER